MSSSSLSLTGALEQSSVEQLTRILELRIPSRAGQKPSDISETARACVGRALVSAEPAAAVVNETLLEASLPAVLGPWEPRTMAREIDDTYIRRDAGYAGSSSGGGDTGSGLTQDALVERLLARIAELERQNSELLERSVGSPAPAPRIPVIKVARPHQQHQKNSPAYLQHAIVPARSRAHYSDTEGEEGEDGDDSRNVGGFGDGHGHRGGHELTGQQQEDDSDNVASLDSSFHSALRELRALALQRQEYEADMRAPEPGVSSPAATRDPLLGQLSTSIERWETNLQQAFGGFSCTEVPSGEGGSDAEGASEDGGGRKRNSTVRVSFDSVASSSSLRSQPRQTHSHLFAPRSPKSNWEHPGLSGTQTRSKELDLSNFDFQRIWAKK